MDIFFYLVLVLYLIYIFHHNSYIHIQDIFFYNLLEGKMDIQYHNFQHSNLHCHILLNYLDNHILFVNLYMWKYHLLYNLLVLFLDINFLHLNNLLLNLHMNHLYKDIYHILIFLNRIFALVLNKIFHHLI